MTCPVFVSPKLRYCVKQFGRLYTQGPRQFYQINDGHVPFAALDPANIVSMKIGKFCEPLLGQFPAQTKQTNLSAH